MPKNIKVATIAAALLVFAMMSGIAALFFRDQTANFVHESAALAFAAWNDAFHSDVNDIFTSETVLDVLPDASSSAIMGPSSTVADVSLSSRDMVLADDAQNVFASPQDDRDLPAKNTSSVLTPDDRISSSSARKISATSSAVVMVDGGSKKISAPLCGASPLAIPSRKVILNEIAWMGSPVSNGESTSAAANREWMELENLSAGAVDLFGWQVVNASRTIKIFFDDHRVVAAGGFVLVARGSASTTTMRADQFYSGMLANGGDRFFVFDGACGLSDALDAAKGWPAGDRSAKLTLERDVDGFGWHTGVFPGGTPGAKNSVPSPVINVSLTSDPTSVPANAVESVAILSADTALPTSSAASNETTALSSYVMATDTLGEFTGPASSSEAASAPEIAASSTIPDCFSAVSGSGGGGSITTSTPAGLDHLIIVAVAIEGASSTNDLIKIFNQTSAAIDVSGWKLRKKTSTGSDQSVRVFPDGSMVLPGAYFMWANSSGGFSEMTGAQVSSTATLAMSNSVALFDASGTIIDAVAWGDGVNQYGEGAPFAADPGAGEMLVRRSDANGFVDTNDNANDFVIQ